MKLKTIIFIFIFSYSSVGNIRISDVGKLRQVKLPFFQNEPVRAETTSVYTTYFSANFDIVSKPQKIERDIQIYIISINDILFATVIKSKEKEMFYSTSSVFKKAGCYYFNRDLNKYYINKFEEKSYNTCFFELTTKKEEVINVKLTYPAFDIAKQNIILYKKEKIRSVTYLTNRNKYQIIGEVRDVFNCEHGVIVNIENGDKGKSFIDKKGRIFMLITDMLIKANKNRLIKACLCKELFFKKG